MSIVYKSMLEVFFVLVLLELIWLKINHLYIKTCFYTFHCTIELVGFA